MLEMDALPLEGDLLETLHVKNKHSPLAIVGMPIFLPIFRHRRNDHP
jgi:hypothetical protein